jgi:hypothetical protein
MNCMKLRATWAFVCLTVSVVPAGHAQVPAGWHVAGSAPQDFQFSVDPTEKWSGHPSALISAKPGIVSNGFGTLMQSIQADNYRGARWRLSGYLKTEGAARAQMWMRVDGTDHSVKAFDNMDDRPVVATKAWARYEIVLDVPRDSLDVAFGFLLTQQGKVWGADFHLDKAAASAAVTSAQVAFPKEPANLDFAQTNEPKVDTQVATREAGLVRAFDLYRGEGKLVRDDYHHYRVSSGANTYFYDVAKYNLCGMHIKAETREPDHDILQWDVKLSVFLDKDKRMASIAAGAFVLPPHAKTPVPREPITQLSIKLEGSSEPGVAILSGDPNTSNGVQGEFPEGYAEKLFDAFDLGKPFTVALTFANGERESILMQTRVNSRIGSFNAGRMSFHDGAAPVSLCLDRLVETTDVGARNQLVELEHPW